MSDNGNPLLAGRGGLVRNWLPMWAEDQMRGLRPGFTDGYDYWNALKYGVQRTPGMDGHMGSRVPQTGLLLKSEQHPTFHLTQKGEAEAGYEVYRGDDGRLYSRPKGRPRNDRAR